MVEQGDSPVKIVARANRAAASSMTDPRASEPPAASHARARPRAAGVGGGRRTWLRGNARPGWIALWLGIAASLVLAWGWSRFEPRPGAVWSALVPLPAVLGGAFLGLAAAPRIVLDGREVVVRLRPLRGERVPLEVVECFFLGSRLEPPPTGDGTRGGHRVRTLVLRFAERAAEFADRRTLAAWGDWREGSATFDGRWCEPLSVDLVRRLNRDLAATKRGEPRP